MNYDQNSKGFFYISRISCSARRTTLNPSDISYDSADMTITHQLEEGEPREPLVVVSLKRDGQEEIMVSVLL